MNLLTVKDLSVRIERKVIIDHVSFELAARDRLSILGPNGAGKTILLRAILRLIPYSGEVTWAPGVKIGYVPQKLDIDRHLPITYRDLFHAKCQTMNASMMEIDEISDSVGLTGELLETPVGHLSGGQFQRGLIGFALLGKPTVLLLDEPTTSIDEPGEEHIYELINRLESQYGLASIMVSHDVSFVSRYATKVLCLNRQIICMGTPQTALDPEVLRRLYSESIGYYHHDHYEHK